MRMVLVSSWTRNFYGQARNWKCGYHHYPTAGISKQVNSKLSVASRRAHPPSRPAQLQIGGSISGSNIGNNSGVHPSVDCFRRSIVTRSISSTTNSSTTTTTSTVTEEVVSAPNGIDFRVTIRNPGAPHPVLCLPGALGTGASDFANLLYDHESLGSDFGIYALDPRGLGGSVYYTPQTSHSVLDEPPPQDQLRFERDYPLDFYERDARDAAHVMQALGISEYSVLGWSDGAIAAVHLAANSQECLNKLVIWGGGAYVTEEDVRAWDSLRNVQKWSNRARAEKEALHGGRERLQTMNDAATEGWMQFYFNPLKFGDVCTDVLPQVDCPTLVLHGAKDVICATHHAEYMAKEIPKAQLTILPDGSHNLHQRHATEFHRLVREFLMEEAR